MPGLLNAGNGEMEEVFTEHISTGEKVPGLWTINKVPGSTEWFVICLEGVEQCRTSNGLEAAKDILYSLATYH